MSDGTTLLPCPFCGGEARLVNDYSSEKGMSYQIWHECTGHEGRSGGYGQGVKPFFETPWYATDAEAIAAWNTRTDYHGYEQAAIEAWKSIKAWNTRATHGTLTAEQVREIVEKHWHDLPDEYDMPEATALPEYSYDWQAIADDLNAGFENDDDYERKMDTLLCRLTNGKWSKSRAYSIEFMDACISEEFEVLYSEEQFSAPVHGTLTAEQVREAIEKRFDFDVWVPPERWQAIADELNAELGSGTCEVECFDDGVDEGLDGEWFSYAPPTWYLSCGHTSQGNDAPNFCPVCGKAVKR